LAGVPVSGAPVSSAPFAGAASSPGDSSVVESSSEDPPRIGRTRYDDFIGVEREGGRQGRRMPQVVSGRGRVHPGCIQGASRVHQGAERRRGVRERTTEARENCNVRRPPLPCPGNGLQRRAHVASCRRQRARTRPYAIDRMPLEAHGLGRTGESVRAEAPCTPDRAQGCRRPYWNMMSVDEGWIRADSAEMRVRTRTRMEIATATVVLIVSTAWFILRLVSRS